MSTLCELEEYVVVNAVPLERNLQNICEASTSTTLNCQTARPAAEYKWTQNETKYLIDLYSKYKKKTGTLEIRNIKMMWQKIAQELKLLKIFVTPNNCSNRWRVLEKNYKKFIDNQNKTGRGRKYFEYEEEMTNIFGKKRNIYPECLLTTETVENFADKKIEEKEPKKSFAVTSPKTPEKKTKQTTEADISIQTKKVRTIKKKRSILESFIMDRKLYYEERLKIEKEKLSEIKKRNELIKERNKILKENSNLNCQGSLLE